MPEAIVRHLRGDEAGSRPGDLRRAPHNGPESAELLLILARNHRPGLAGKPLEPKETARREGNNPALASLALPLGDEDLPLLEVHGLPLEPGHLLGSDSAKALESDTGKEVRTPSLILGDSGKRALGHKQEGAKLCRGDYLGLLFLGPLLPSLLDLSTRVPRELAVLNGPPEKDRKVPPVVVKGGRAHREGIEPLLQGPGAGIGGEEAEGLERELGEEEPLEPVPGIPSRVLL